MENLKPSPNVRKVELQEAPTREVPPSPQITAPMMDKDEASSVASPFNENESQHSNAPNFLVAFEESSNADRDNGIRFNGVQSMGDLSVNQDVPENDSNIIVSKYGMKWYEPSLELWLWQAHEKSPVSDEYQDTLPSPPLLYYSEQTSSWCPVSLLGNKGDRVDEKWEADCVHPSHMADHTIKNQRSNHNSESFIHLRMSPKVNRFKDTLLRDEKRTSMDLEIQTEIKLAKLERLEKIDMIEKMIAEKELAILERDLFQPKVSYFPDGLAFTVDHVNLSSTSSYLISPKVNLMDGRKQFSLTGFGDTRPSVHSEKVLPERTHIWCRSDAPGSRNGFRPVNFQEKHISHDDTRERLFCGSDIEERRKERKQCVHGSFTFHLDKENERVGAGVDLGSVRKAEIRHKRDFEWLGRPVSVERPYSFEYNLEEYIKSKEKAE